MSVVGSSLITIYYVKLNLFIMAKDCKYLSQLERFSDGNLRCVPGSRIRVTLVFGQIYVVYYGNLSNFNQLSFELMRFDITPIQLEINPTGSTELFVDTFSEYKVARTLFSVNNFKQYGIFEKI